MKYWRGYLAAAILGALTWVLTQMGQRYTNLVDMVYPYVTRMIQNFMAGWSGGVTFCLWQGILLALVAVAVATVVLMIVLKWNPIRWGGWMCCWSPITFPVRKRMKCCATSSTA